MGWLWGGKCKQPKVNEGEMEGKVQDGEECGLDCEDVSCRDRHMCQVSVNLRRAPVNYSLQPDGISFPVALGLSVPGNIASLCRRSLLNLSHSFILTWLFIQILH
ncbi:hypothetical protein M413DRAFT_115282 [Hebeloma cylindrosporum]|uniref:Uncharacterized protein n=1 Tax=Hebeloma cylindrosporum TaxID=76867 RepID=A0A0C2YIY8_HEBCY|nr:hypothetical protein M413DRAFT_115282 [Hebeloma cylindrosporum h7]